MFTGIITDIANVRAIEKTGDTRFEFTTSFDTSKIVLG
ncbi:MAG TPA: riboflavin synthase, partial [Thalassospira lucentensis]|nr:riboflavin synthase [Thalassospira lucentensis]